MNSKIIYTAINCLILFGSVPNEDSATTPISTMYIQDGAACISINTCLSGLLNPVFQKGISGSQAFIQSTIEQHLLWEDPGCNTTPIMWN